MQNLCIAEILDQMVETVLCIGF